MKRSRYLLLAVLLVGLFGLACSLTDQAVDKAKDAAQETVQEVSKTAEAAVGEVAQQAEKTGEEVQQAAQEAQEKTAESGEKVEEAAKEAQEAAETAVEGETEEAELNVGNIDETLANFDSYRSKFIMTFEGVDGAGKSDNGRVEVLSEYVKSPPATHMLMKMDGATTGEEDGSMSMEIYTVDGMTYMYMDEMGWMSSPATDDDTFTQGFFSTDDMLEDLPKSAKRSLLPQDVNGISTWHYTFDETDMPADETMHIEFASGEVWIARDGGYPVKMLIEIKGKDIAGADDASFMADGTMKMEYELLEVNGNINISLPEEALGGAGGGSDLPMLDDAEVQLSMEGMLNYYTAASVQDAVAFYKDKLSAEGWTIDDSFEMVIEDSAMLSFTKDNLELSLIIGVEDDGKTNVTLMTNEQ